MASGKKNFFRHFVGARNDPKIMDIMDRFGKQGYFYYFCIVDMCAELWLDSECNEFIFTRSRLMRELGLKSNKLQTFLEHLSNVSLMSCKRSANVYKIEIPNLSKYIGFQNKKNPNKIREEKIRLDKIKKYKKKIPENQTLLPSESFEREKKLVKFWNFKQIIRHELSERNFEKIKSALKKRPELSDAQLMQAIDNYSEALNGSRPFTYKWTLFEFITRENAQKFYGSNYIRDNYFIRSKQEQRQNNMLNMENPYAK